MTTILRNVQFLLEGSKKFSRNGYAHAAKAFDNTVMERKLNGKVCVVTGANQGIGLETSQELARRGATLLMVCRSAEKGKLAVEQVQVKSGNSDVHLKLCDMSNLASIKALADELRATYTNGVHLLVNNAGVMVNDRQLSADGYDINFATNTLGPFTLTLLMEELLVAGAVAGGTSKVVFVSSGGMLTQKLDIDDLQNEGMLKHYDGTTAYAKDKRRLVAVAERMAELWQGKGVHVYSMHPGWTTTEGVKKSIPGFYKFYEKKFRDLHQGADTIVYLALEDDSKLVPGGFYLDRTPQHKHLGVGGTKYDSRQVDALFTKLYQLAAKVLSPPLPPLSPPAPGRAAPAPAAPAADQPSLATTAIGPPTPALQTDANQVTPPLLQAIPAPPAAVQPRPLATH